MVGRSALHAALESPTISHVTALVRRPIARTSTKLSVQLHQDFTDYTSIVDIFSSHDAIWWCLGISQTKVTSEAEYIRITYEYAVAAARAALAVNPKVKFLFVSGAGADPSESSKTLFRRIKGRTERALAEMPFASEALYLLRPAGIIPGPEGNSEGPTFERLLYPVLAMLRPVLPTYVIRAPELAEAMCTITTSAIPANIRADFTKLGNAAIVHNRQLIELSRT